MKFKFKSMHFIDNEDVIAKLGLHALYSHKTDKKLVALMYL